MIPLLLSNVVISTLQGTASRSLDFTKQLKQRVNELIVAKVQPPPPPLFPPSSLSRPRYLPHRYMTVPPFPATIEALMSACSPC